jgi:Flp pilus assembly protein TadD
MTALRTTFRQKHHTETAMERYTFWLRLRRIVLRLNPNNALAHNDLGFALEKKGDRQGALEEYRAATTLDPKDALYNLNPA